MWRRVARSSVASASCPAVTVTVCAVLQVVAVKVSAVGSGVTSGVPLVTETTTPPEQPAGALSRATVYVPWLALAVPGASSSDRLARETVTPGGAPGATGRVPVVRSPEPECAAASTFTARVEAASKP